MKQYLKEIIYDNSTGENGLMMDRKLNSDINDEIADIKRDILDADNNDMGIEQEFEGETGIRHRI